MNRRKTLLMVVIVLHSSLITLHLNAQSLTLDECKQEARDNYPAIRQYDLIAKSRDLNVSNAAKSWLPGISVSGFGAGFTDVLDMPTQASAMFGDMKNYAYGASLMITQPIYDGGAISAKKEMATAKAEVDQSQLDVSLYSINERVEQLFFGVLLIDEQLKQNRLLQDDLGVSEKTVKSLIEGGLANQSDLDAVNVNQVQAEQQEMSLRSSRKTYIDMLGYFIGRELGENTQLTKPAASPRSGVEEVARPELSYFASQEKLLDAQKKSLNARLIPTVSAFGMGTYHNKIMDLMKDNLLAGGVTVRWNVGALYTRKNDLANIENQRSQIAAQRETFLFNNHMQSRQSNGQIENLEKQMALDDKAITLRESIREKSEKKVKNGTETVNELIRDVNAVSEARQQKAIHEIQLLKEEYNLRTINNN